MTLMQILTATGLALGAGQRAILVALLLGLAHHTPYFTLGERFLWLAVPPVLAVLGVLTLVELLADWFPEINEFSEAAAVLPRLTVGFIAAAASIGSVDPSLPALATSGLLGSAAAYGAHRASRSLRATTREIDDSADRMASASTTASAVALTGSALFAPALIIPLVVVVVIAVVVLVLIFRRMRSAVAAASGMDLDPDEPT